MMIWFRRGKAIFLKRPPDTSRVSATAVFICYAICSLLKGISRADESARGSSITGAVGVCLAAIGTVMGTENIIPTAGLTFSVSDLLSRR